MRKNKYLYFLVLITVLLSGCWDSINLEERGFIIGTAIDLEEESQSNAEQPKFTISNQLVIPAGVGSPSQVGGQEKAFLNITSNGESIYRVNKEFTALSSKVPFYEHLAVLIISEDIARTKGMLSHLLDTYIRNVNMRRGIKVVVSKEDPKELLEFTTPENKLPALHIEQLLLQSSKHSGFLRPIVVGDIEEYHLRGNSYVLPLLELNETIEYKSGAIFHGQKKEMVGTFNADEMEGLELMESNVTEKVIDFPYKDVIFAFEVVKIKNNIKVDPTNIDRIKATIDIELEGIIKESFSKQDFKESKEINAVQQAVSEQVKKSVEKAIQKGQKELNADVFHIWRIMETKHYDTWKKVRDDWEKGENYFANVTFDINVRTEVYSMGTSNKTS